MDNAILTVSQLTQSIKGMLEGNFHSICVEGEISNGKIHTSGHFYFSLKDAQAQISAVLFRIENAKLPRMPKDGDQVTIKGGLNVYPPTGKYQIVVRSLEFSGLGALLLKLEALKIKLKGLGWFDKVHKKPLPLFPKTIGVVTSPTGAVIQDIVQVLTRRAPHMRLILYPVKVQGEGAAQEIAQAIDFFNQYHLADLLIVGRGGGSIEDLWAFNEEIVAAAIFKSHIPIISAVGHETDFCIADFVADLRAPTPSAAAEMATAERMAQIERLFQLRQALGQTVRHLIRQEEQRLKNLQRHPLLTSPYALLALKIQRLDELRLHIDRAMRLYAEKASLRLQSLRKQKEALNPLVRITHLLEKLLFYRQAIDQSWNKQNERKRRSLNHLSELLHALNPRSLLNKGYALAFAEKGGSIIKSINSLKVGQPFYLSLADGDAEALTVHLYQKGTI